ncbi:hypothetical protein J6590_052511 [Homalodisca vitripennis]|nr:hypothetical protein J6590_052511 [Homalodisca vitripennis]
MILIVCKTNLSSRNKTGAAPRPMFPTTPNPRCQVPSSLCDIYHRRPGLASPEIAYLLHLGPNLLASIFGPIKGASFSSVSQLVIASGA